MSQVKAIVLLSGGLDSVYNLYRAHQEWSGAVMSLFFRYGQRAVDQELAAARHFSQHLRVDLQVIDLTEIFSFGKSALTSDHQILPLETVDIESLEKSQKSAEAVWVPNRNGVFLNVAASLAESLKIPVIVPGFNKEEAATFPDNSQEFIAAINHAFEFSTAIKVRVECFSQDMDKTQIVKASKELGIPLEKLWSCYEAGEKPCDLCEPCQRLKRALKQ